MQRERGKLLHSFGTNVSKAKSHLFFRSVRGITRRPLSADRRKKHDVEDDVSGGLSTSGHESKSQDFKLRSETKWKLAQTL